MRCNIIDPSELTDQHLIAEKRELRMIPPLVEKRFNKFRSYVSACRDIPGKFTLNKGHMLFWTDKLQYLDKRYTSILNEMVARGFKPDFNIKFDYEFGQAHGFYNDWEPTDESIILIRERLQEKLMMKPDWYKFHGKSVGIEKAETFYLI